MTTTRPPALPKPAKRRTQAERTQQTRQKLVKGAIALLKQKRYAGFRIAEAAAVSGVSRGAQTHHFPNKDSLVLEALEAVFIETQRKALARIAKAGAEPVRMLDALIADSTDFFLGEDFYLSLDLMMVGGDQPLGVAVRKLAQQYRVSVEHAWQEIFIEAGHSPREAEDVVLLTFSIARGIGIRKLMSGDSAHFQRLFSLWESLARDLLKATAGTKQRELPPTSPRARNPGRRG